MADNCALPETSKCYDDDDEKDDDDDDDDDDDGMGLFLSSSSTFWSPFLFPHLYTWMIFRKPWWKYFYQRVYSTLDQRLTLDPCGPISPRSPSLPVFPYKINSIFIRRHPLVLALALQKVDSTAQLVSLILSRWTAILATSSSGSSRAKGG